MCTDAIFTCLVSNARSMIGIVRVVPEFMISGVTLWTIALTNLRLSIQMKRDSVQW